MANPIIKIKRGTGKPLVWSGISGLTAGEFALDTNTGVLFMGMQGAGGYTGHFDDNVYSIFTNTKPNVIPVGYQISNDSTFGGGGSPAIDDTLGYSSYTVPSTYAVREFVLNSVIAAAVGVEFKAGVGISVVKDGPAGTTYTITNTGVLKGFTSANTIGNAFGDRLYAKSAVDGITFVGGGGIALRSSNANGSLEVQNYGVTSIGGVTGDISTFTPIVTLSGFTTGIGLANRVVVTAASGTPLTVTNNNTTSGIDIAHATSGSGSASLSAYVGGVPQLLALKYNNYGHIESVSQSNLDFGVGLPVGFAEAVQDAAYPGITSGHNKNYGIYFVYDDANNLLKAYNRGITSIAVSGYAGLSGPVTMLPGNNILLTQNNSSNTITVDYDGFQFLDYLAGQPSSYGYPQSGIYIGGVTGPGLSQILEAEDSVDSMTILAGRGIGISMGIQASNKTMLFWNAGVNRISAYNSGGSLLGGTGFSGNIDLIAGNNIQFTRGSGSTDNQLTISSTSGGGGGAISYIQGDYTTETSPAEDYTGRYSGDGVTGAINFVGINGLITKQDTGNNGSPSTKNGSLYVGLSSKVHIPANVVTDDFPDSSGYPSELVIATARETAVPTLPPLSYNATPIGYSRVVTDVVEGGFTGELTYGGDPGPGEPFSPDYTAFTGPNTTPGKILILRAREGYLDRPSGFDPTVTGLHAEIRLLGYPNPENLSAYIDEVYDHAAASTNSAAGCPGGNCVGFPPVLPSCTIPVEGSSVYYYTDSGSSTENHRGTAVFHTDIVARDSVFIKKDLWITGEIIDATTGCLYAGGGGGGGTNVFNGGNLGLTGDLVVNGSIYVHGGTAYFNVGKLATESPLLRIGGVSYAGANYSDEYTTLTPTQSGYTGDRGLLLYTYNKIPYSPLHSVAADSSETARVNFVGVDASEGVYKYVQNATLTTQGSGSNIVTYVSGGRLGPAKFSEINNVGITSDNTIISLRTGGAPTNPTDVQLSGYANITASQTPANRATITLGNVAQVNFGSVAYSSIIDFTRGITFSSVAASTGFDSEANALRIKYNGTDDVGRNISIRNPGQNKFVQVVDIGRAAASDNSTTPGFVDLAQQTIYNKTLSEGTIIDCGTY